MSQRAHPIEFNEAPGQITVPFIYRAPHLPGSTVRIRFALPGQSWQDQQLTDNNGLFETTVEMPEGAQFYYQFEITEPGKNPQLKPATPQLGLAQPASPQAPGSPAPVSPRAGAAAPGVSLSSLPPSGGRPGQSLTPVDSLRSRVKGPLQTLLKRTQTPEGSTTLDGIFDELGLTLEQIRDASRNPESMSNMTPLLIQLLGEAIWEDNAFPQALRAEFPPNRPVTSMADLQSRITKGSDLYRRKVFAKMKQNPRAAEVLGIKPTAEYKPGGGAFSDASSRELFDRLCSQRDLGLLSPHLPVAFASVAEMDRRSPELEKQRRDLLERVVKRVDPTKRNLLDRMKGGGKGRMLDIAVHTGATGAILAGSFGVGFGLLAAKGALEATTGITPADVAEAYEKGSAWKLMKRLATENIAAKLLFSRKGAAEVMKDRLRHVGRSLIPGRAFFKDSSQQSIDGEATNAPDKVVRSAEAEQLINEACQAALT
ncbi:hypothetical protein CO046_03110 [Candidatus Peregrinibacteria bacterium CG_4_9_14_0_2_um_filter_53_11]|nr:MAG: hypothetical protein CO046_03110 [Candidatus Peregrinibacteria bacterium CG_4_9_14_0_2_um_filter_53_11]